MKNAMKANINYNHNRRMRKREESETEKMDSNGGPNTRESAKNSTASWTG